MQHDDRGDVEAADELEDLVALLVISTRRALERFPDQLMVWGHPIR
ncbi:MAG: hypothetical protein ACRDST_14875 [Pseudonocardiaceae bacterium]